MTQIDIDNQYEVVETSFLTWVIWPLFQDEAWCPTVRMKMSFRKWAIRAVVILNYLSKPSVIRIALKQGEGA